MVGVYCVQRVKKIITITNNHSVEIEWRFAVHLPH